MTASGTRAPTAPVIVRQIRVGTHPEFTRVVVELTGAAEYTVERQADGGARVLVLNAGMGAGLRRIEPVHGNIAAVQPSSRGPHVEVLITYAPAQAQIRSLTVPNPFRIVIDVLGAEAPRREHLAVPAPARQASAPPVQAGRPLSAAPELAAPVPPANAVPKPEPSQLIIVLDPGHGGHDTGAIGAGGLMEKDVVLDLALRLRKLLIERLGVRVLLTREDDTFVPLPDRTALANRAKADFMVSLHVNAASARRAGGFETYFFTREPSDSDARAAAQRENLVVETPGTPDKSLEALLKTTLADMAVSRDMQESSKLAERLLFSLDKMLRVENRGVKSGPFYVLATAAMPAVLVESAFISNPREERKLQNGEYRQRVAEALYEGIAAYKVRYEQRLGLGAPANDIGS
ncbi:MAG TPA: N-acetylmuramoyl-L-alanine amidase [Candidatus Baltobacteraceae bacterium]|nr:N-acetylmuramoyl-L-alanine amidase [Candidatus Baltobacteraceae bacterium]